VVENTTHVKADDTMTGTTIDCRYGVTVRWPNRRNTMTGITGDTHTDNFRTGMVGKCVQESFNRMTGYAVRVGDRVIPGWGIDGRRRLTDSSVTVVATGTSTRDAGVIKTTVQAKFKKTGGIVAIIALGGCLYMEFGFTDGLHAVMASAAATKHFLMIDKRNDVKTQRGMTGLAHTAGTDVIQRFPWNLARAGSSIDVIAMTIQAN
jgi:hypothetical protein